MNLGDTAPDFSLPGVDGKTHALSDFASARVLVYVQTCNHCPYVIGYQDRVNALARAYAERGVAFVGVNSNNPATHPADSFANMQVRAREVGLPFPYLFDESQSTARAYGAQRTPEFYVFDAERRLVYHGRLDDNLEQPEQVGQRYLADAIEAALAGEPPPVAETPAVGCTVKWK